MLRRKSHHLSSIVIPNELKQYQNVIDLLWNDKLRYKDVDKIVNQLAQFYTNGTITLDFINNMIHILIYFHTKNEHLAYVIASKFYQKTSTNFDFFRYLKPESYGSIDDILIDDNLEKLKNSEIHSNLTNRAAYFGAVKCFKHFANVFQTTFDKETMKLAIKGGNSEIIKMVSDKVEIATKKNLKIAIVCHRNNIVEGKLERNFDLFRDILTMTHLYNMNYQVFLFAIYNRIYNDAGWCFHYDITLVNVYPIPFFQYIISIGYRVDFCFWHFEESFNLLFEALKNKKFELARFLVENGANVNTALFLSNGSTPGETCTPLKYAIEYNDIALAKFFLDHGADKNQDIFFMMDCQTIIKRAVDYAVSDEMKSFINDYEPIRSHSIYCIIL